VGTLTGANHCDTSHCIAKAYATRRVLRAWHRRAAGDASDSHGPPEWQERVASYRLIEVLIRRQLDHERLRSFSTA
jgi:hypothetical protein